MKSKHLIEPEAREFIAALEPLTLSRERLPALRAAAAQSRSEQQRPPAIGVTVRTARAPGVGEAPDVPLIFYAPTSGNMSRAALLQIHGGGYVMGDAEGEAEWCEWLALSLGCVVISPEYRLAPESRYPKPLEDCYAALTWIHNHSQSLGADPQRIAVWGGSAGGGLAAALALLARDRGEISLCFQCLLYPMLDDRTSLAPDPNEFAGEYVWTRANNAFGWESLLDREPGHPDISPHAAPARAIDLAGLPPTFIWVGALDLFVDENIEYARRLIRAGVPTELHVYPGVTHGNILQPDLPSSRQCLATTLNALKRAFKE